MHLFDPNLWGRIEAQPAIGLTAILFAYFLAQRVHRMGRAHPLINPTLVSILIVAVAVKVSGITYATYAQSAGFVGLDNAQATAVWRPFFDWVEGRRRPCPQRQPWRGRPAGAPLVGRRRQHSHDRRSARGRAQLDGWLRAGQARIGAFLHGYESL